MASRFLIIAMLCTTLAAQARTYFDATLFDVFDGNPTAIIYGPNSKVNFDSEGRLSSVNGISVSDAKRDAYGRLTSYRAAGTFEIEYVDDTYRVATVSENNEEPVRNVYIQGMLIKQTRDGLTVANFSDYAHDGYDNWIKRTRTDVNGNVEKQVRTVSYDTMDDMGVPKQAQPMPVGKSETKQNTAAAGNKAAEKPAGSKKSGENTGENAAKATSDDGKNDDKPEADRDDKAAENEGDAVDVDKVSAKIASARLAQSSKGINGTLTVSCTYTLTGLEKAGVRLTMLHADGSAVKNLNLAPTVGWTNANHIITRTSTVTARPGNQQRFSSSLPAWVLQGVALVTSVKFKIEFLGTDGKVLATAMTNAIAVGK